MSRTNTDQFTSVLRLTLAAADCNGGVIFDRTGVRAALGVDVASLKESELTLMRSVASSAAVGSIGSLAFAAASYSDDGVLAIFHPDPWLLSDACVRAQLTAACQVLSQLADPGVSRTFVGRSGEPVDIEGALEKRRVTTHGNDRAVRMLGISLDITDRKAVEQARSMSQTRFERTFTNAAIGMAITDSAGYFLRANNAYCDLTGYREDELRHLTFVDITHPEDVGKTLDLKERLLRGGESIYTSEKRYVRSDGRTVWVRISVSLLPPDGSSEPITIVICEDITNRRRAEQLLQESEQRYRMVVERATDIIYQTDASGRITFCNRAAVELLDSEDDSIAGLDYLQFVSPEWRNRVRRFYTAQLRRRTPSTYLELPLISRRGRERWIGQNVQLVFDSDVVLGFQVIGRDITDRIALDNKLKQSEMRFRSLIEYSTDLITILSPDGTIMYQSPSMERLFGYPPEERVGRSTFDFLHPDDIERVRATFAEAGAVHGAIRTLEARLRDSNGNWRTVEVIGRNLLAVPAVRGIVVNSRDVTESRAAQTALEHYAAELKLKNAELAAAVQAAKDATGMKSRFLANMSHEIRTPMNGVLGMTELLLGTTLNAEQRGFTETIRSSAETLLTIINDILDFSKIESGKLRLERASFRVRQLVAGIQKMFEIRARMKGITFSCSVSDDTPDELIGDCVRLGQVITNLVGNAIKFTHRGSVRVQLSCTEITTDRCAIRADVTDTGIGVSRENGDHLFQSFVQGDTSTTRKYGGTGLGLAISKELVTLMGGDIGFTSEPGRGSTFWFTAVLDRNSSAAAHEPARDLPHSTASGRILLADDNSVNRRIAEAMLSHLGHSVDAVNNGRAALEAVRRSTYDLVLMDVQMPELDGFEATRAIRRLGTPAAKVPIIAMTAHAMAGDRERCIEAGMDDYVAKPVTRESLENAVARWLQRHDLNRLQNSIAAATFEAEESIASPPARES